MLILAGRGKKTLRSRWYGSSPVVQAFGVEAKSFSRRLLSPPSLTLPPSSKHLKATLIAYHQSNRTAVAVRASMNRHLRHVDETLAPSSRWLFFWHCTPFISNYRCLDMDSDFPPSLPLEAFASSVMIFLSALPEPLVPLSAVTAVESALSAHRADDDAGGSGAWTAGFLRALSPARHNTFLYIV